MHTESKAYPEVLLNERALALKAVADGCLSFAQAKVQDEELFKQFIKTSLSLLKLINVEEDLNVGAG